MKTCRRCENPFPETEFQISPGKPKLRAMCRECWRAYKREWYAKRKQPAKRKPAKLKQPKPKRPTFKSVPAPPGLLAKVVWYARRHGPPDPWRNYLCPYYDRCLDAAACHEPALNFTCRHCEHEAARQIYRPDLRDLAGCIGLLFVVNSDRECTCAVNVVNRVADRLGEMVSFIAGELPRHIDEPHWGRPDPA